jgi:hypothetical protein
MHVAKETTTTLLQLSALEHYKIDVTMLATAEHHKDQNSNITK